MSDDKIEITPQMRYHCIGEFSVYDYIDCADCYGEGTDEFGTECETCDGEGEYKFIITIDWPTIKDIYKRMKKYEPK